MADFATRYFLRRICNEFSHLPVFALVDCDPAGVDILCNYTFGSMKNPELSSWLTVPFIHWLDLFPSDIIDTRFKIPLTKADEKILER